MMDMKGMEPYRMMVEDHAKECGGHYSPHDMTGAFAIKCEKCGIRLCSSLSVYEESDIALASYGYRFSKKYMQNWFCRINLKHVHKTLSQRLMEKL